MSVSASFIILAGIIIRAICIHKLPKRTFLAIWVIAVLRLIIPVSITSRFSILNISDSFLAIVPSGSAIRGQDAFPATTGTGTTMSAFVPDVIIDPTMLDSGTIESYTTGVTSVAGTFEFGGAFLLFVVWLTVAICLALYFIVAYLRCYKVYRTAMPIENNIFIQRWIESHPIKRGLRINQSDRINTPLTYGILKPVILLPSHMISSDNTRLTYILTHEYIHVRRFDALFKWILATTLALHWFNPLVWIMYILTNRDIELSCDEAVVNLLGDHRKTEYAMTLLGLAEERGKLLSLSNSFSKNAARERVVSIMKNHKFSYITMVAVIVAVSCVTLMFATSGTAANITEYERLNEVSSQVSFVPALPEELHGKVAIVTVGYNTSAEEIGFIRNLQTQFGFENIIHKMWPGDFFQEAEVMVDVLQEIAADPDVRILIIKQAVANTNAAVRSFREVRDDVFIVYGSPAEDHSEAVMLADLILGTNDILSGEAIVMQAKSMGAETIIHYSFPRHMAIPLLAAKRDVMKEVAGREGLQFVEIEAPDPFQAYGTTDLQAFLMYDVPRQVEKFGNNTAFFGTSCGMQTSLISHVVETGAIFPQPCCPSPLHGFPAALGIADRVYTGEFGEHNEEIVLMRKVIDIVADTRAVLDEKGLGGRLSTWAVPAASMWSAIGVAYAIEWLNGNVPQEHGVIDLAVLARLADHYVENAVGTPLGASLEFLEHDGRIYSNFVLMMVGFLTF